MGKARKKTKKPERVPSLRAYMRRRGVNPRMVAELLGITQYPVREWMETGKIPAWRMQRLLSLTKEETDAKKRWAPCDLVDLRERLGMGRTDLARALAVNERTLNFWEKDKRVLRTLLPRVRELEAQAKGWE